MCRRPLPCLHTDHGMQSNVHTKGLSSKLCVCVDTHSTVSEQQNKQGVDCFTPVWGPDTPLQGPSSPCTGST